jgi:hypothetical protein
MSPSRAVARAAPACAGARSRPSARATPGAARSALPEIETEGSREEEKKDLD